MKVGLALSGGGARGIMHLGVMQALSEAGIVLHALSGTSAGSIAGALVAHGIPPKEALQIIKDTSLLTIVRPAFSKSGLLKLDKLAHILRKHIPHDSFEGLQIPLTVVATDLQKGVSHYFNEGELAMPVLASSCVPVVFDPISFNGNVYVDGGLLDNLPVSCLEGKVDIIIGSHCNPIDTNFSVTHGRRVIERSLLMAINGNVQMSKAKCQVVIEPEAISKYSGADLSKADELFYIGYQHTQQQINEILSILK
ncbi:patatin-like phospholipase family protein [Cytophagales bacterium LB-30]|uniref:Patatin-like phospholipase family protein n=1 Tax=Shiella aurantiaca TaxID=3058365 RepID=A0ABT8F1A5_9BACT|nr:patatin-like phospholipase family protein [Shiella aurantiaca]MDN4164073.1 patatin-like phospholipase family protein [Shiella aurantiaca]